VPKQLHVQGPPNEYQTFLATRPPLFERDAVKLLIELLDKDSTPASPGFSVHIAHLSDAGCLPLIQVCDMISLNQGLQDPEGQFLYICAASIRYWLSDSPLYVGTDCNRTRY